MSSFDLRDFRKNKKFFKTLIKALWLLEKYALHSDFCVAIEEKKAFNDVMCELENMIETD